MCNFAPENMKLQTSLPAVSFDAAGLAAWATGLCEKYQGLVVTEEQVPQIKQEMAELNKAKNQIDIARKETVKRLSAPLKEFEAEVRKVVTIFDNTYKALAQQVKAFADQDRESRRPAVEAMLAEVLKEYGLDDYAIAIQERWLNKSTSQKSIREEAAAIAERELANRKANDATDKLHQERAALIERVVATNNKTYRLDIPVSKFITQKLMDPETDSGDVCASIYAEFARAVAEQKHQQEQETQAESTQPDPAQAPAPAAITPPWEDKPAEPTGETVTMQFFMSWDMSCDEDVRVLLRQIKEMCLSFSARRINTGK